MDFWVSIGSTYSYLTVMRIEQAATDAGVALRWRPFNVRDIMVSQNNIPFRDKPVKTAYMWRDMERRAMTHGLPISVPAPYPLTHLPLANQVALVGMREGWGVDYIKQTYKRWFVDSEPAGSEPNLSASLAALGVDAAAAIATAHSDEFVDLLAAQTQIAMDIGVFGSPSFVIGPEVFWGDDRLEDALAWAKTRA